MVNLTTSRRHKPRGTKMTYKTTTIQIKRPEGNIETVDVSANYPSGLSDIMFAKMAAATKAAGRGDMISYSVVIAAPSAEEIAEIREEDKKVAFMTRNGFSSQNF